MMVMMVAMVAGYGRVNEDEDESLKVLIMVIGRRGV